MKILVIFIAIWSIPVESVTNQQHMIRMTAMSRMRSPTPFRPGVNVRWSQQKPGPSQRNPFVFYRGAPNRHNKFPPSNPGRFNSVNTWKASPRLPQVSPAEVDLVRAAASAAVKQQHQQSQQQFSQPQQQFSQPQQQIAQPQQQFAQPQQQHAQPQLLKPHQHKYSQNGGTDAIHTIPAPNLSFSEKPIVVLENTDSAPTPNPGQFTSVTPSSIFHFNNYKQNGWKDPSPIKFGPRPPSETRFAFPKGPSATAPELTSLIRNAAALQFASEYGLSAMTLPPTSVGPQHHTLHHHTPIPLQGFQGIPNSHEFLPTGINSIIIPPNMYQPNPVFMQRLQNQILQRFPTVEFVPYHFDQNHHQISLEPQSSQQNHVFVTNSGITPAPSHQLTVIPLKNDTKTQVIRETSEATVTLTPQALVSNNVTENIIESVSITDPQNATVPSIAQESKTESANGTEKPVTVTSLENEKTTPIYYAQVGQSIGNIEANGLYTAINDVRAASVMADSSSVRNANLTATTEHPDLKTYFIQSTETDENNNTINDIKPLLGVPFTKSDTVKIAYTLVRNDDKNAIIEKDGSVYAGQIIEASISEDQDFNKEKAELLSRRPPIRLMATTVEMPQTTSATPKLTVVKAKIPPKSKLTFDDKTGEPILRIYASYMDSPLQKEIITSKLAAIKHVKEITSRKEEAPLEWSTDNYKSLSKQTDNGRTTQFGHTERLAERATTQPLSHSARIHLLSQTERTQPSKIVEKEHLTSERITQPTGIPTSEKIPQTSEKVPFTSENVLLTSEKLPVTFETLPQTSETLPVSSERYTQGNTDSTFTINTERSRPFERRPETTPTMRPERRPNESHRGSETFGRPDRVSPQIMQRDSYSKVSQFGHGHTRKPFEHSSNKPSNGRAHDNAIETDKKLNSDVNIGQFGLKLKSRMDDIIPIFEDY